MLLTVDIGNTQTALCLYSGAEEVASWRIYTHKRVTSDEVRTALIPLFDSEGLSFDLVKKTAVASVVPTITSAWCEAIEHLTGTKSIVCNAQTAASLFKTNYPNPREIGSDRIADAIAAQTLYGAPVVVVDFGTATNIEVVDKDGYFVGGILAPGMETSALALFSQATRLSAIELEAPEHAIGLSSEEALQSGIVFGEAERVDGLLTRIFIELGYVTPVVATGGLCERIAPHSERITHVNRNLTLEGLRILAESVQ